MIVLQSNTQSILLRDIGYPKYTLDLKVKITRSMDGEMKAVKQTPALLTIDQTIAFLSKWDYDAFVAFCFANAGILLRLTDRLNIVTSVYVEPQEISDEARSYRTCQLRMISNG